MLQNIVLKKNTFDRLKIATNILSILLASIIILNSFRISLTYAYYYLDTSGFIERLCVNKDKPEMHCNGNCHLKKVVESNKTDDNLPVNAIDFKEINLFVIDQVYYKFISKQFQKAEYKIYKNLYAYSVVSIVDHPPQS